MDETWLYHYEPKTKQQSIEWRHSGSPRSKNFECKIYVENISPRLFGMKTASSSLIIFQRAKLSMRSITHLFWWNSRKFWRKNNEGISPKLSCSCTVRQWSGLPGTCNPEETGLPGIPVSWKPILFSGSGHVDPPPVHWTEKMEVSTFFVQRGVHCYRGDLAGRTNFLIFWVVCRS